MMDSVLTWVAASLTLGTIILFGALGEILTEKSGHLNLGVPGMMFFGAFAGFAAVLKYELANRGQTSDFALVIIPLVVGFAAAAALGLLYSFFTVTLKANQNVTGLAITFLGVGLGSFYGQRILQAAKMGYGRTAATAIFTDSLFGKDFDIGFMVIVGIVVAILLQLFLSKTRKGLNLRAVGENPATADAAGINVNLNKYMATCVGAGISGLGGAMYIGHLGWTTNNNIEALGWLAVALVIFATWKPVNAVWGSYLFALFYNFKTYFSSMFNVTLPRDISTAIGDLLQMIPYVVTIIILILIAYRKKRENQPPAALGLSYFREER